MPFKEKDAIIAEFKEAMQEKFPLFASRQRSGQTRQASAPKSPKDVLIAKYNALQQDITTYENNIGFFAASKNSAPLIQQMQQKIDDAKEELKKLEERIRMEEDAS